MSEEPDVQGGARPAVAPVDFAPRRRGRGDRVIEQARRPLWRTRPIADRAHVSPVRRVFLWLYLLTALLVALGVLLQAFSIAAYARGAGPDALEMHQTGGFLTHNFEIIVFLAALVAYWGSWKRVGFALLLPVIGTIQVFLIGETNTSGSWVNGLHGLFALVVLLLAVALAQEGKRSLRRSAG